MTETDTPFPQPERCPHHEPGGIEFDGAHLICNRRVGHDGDHHLDKAMFYDPDYPEAYITRFGTEHDQ